MPDPLDVKDGWTRRELVRNGFGFAFQVPASWRYQPDEVGVRVVVTPEPDVPECVEIMTQAAGYAASMETVAAYGVEQLSQHVAGVAITARETRRLAHADAFEMAFEFEDARGALTALRVFAINGNVMVRITYTARRERFAQFEDIARALIETVQLYPDRA